MYFIITRNIGHYPCYAEILYQMFAILLKICNDFLSAADQSYPQYVEEIRGVADGAEVPFHHVRTGWNIAMTTHERPSVSNRPQCDCMFNSLFIITAKKTKFTHYLLFVRSINRGIAELWIPPQRVNNAEIVFMFWRHHEDVHSTQLLVYHYHNKKHESSFVFKYKIFTNDNTVTHGMWDLALLIKDVLYPYRATVH